MDNKFTELVKMYIDWACAYNLEIEWIDIFRECCKVHVAIEDIAELAEEEIYKSSYLFFPTFVILHKKYFQHIAQNFR